MQNHKPDNFLAIRQYLENLSDKEIDVLVISQVEESIKRKNYQAMTKDAEREVRIQLACDLLTHEMAKREERKNRKIRATDPYRFCDSGVVIPRPQSDSLIEVGPGVSKEILSERLFYEDTPKEVTQAVCRTIGVIQLAKIEVPIPAWEEIELPSEEDLIEEDTVFIEVDPPKSNPPEPGPNSSGRYTIVRGKKFTSDDE